MSKTVQHKELHNNPCLIVGFLLWISFLLKFFLLGIILFNSFKLLPECADGATYTHKHTEMHTSPHLQCFVEWPVVICEKQDYHKSSNVISFLRCFQLNCVLKGFCVGFPLGRKAIKHCNEALLSISA